MKVKELPYKQGYDAGAKGERTRSNPYWTDYEDGNAWAFHAWLNGWSDANNEKLLQEKKQ